MKPITPRRPFPPALALLLALAVAAFVPACGGDEKADTGEATAQDGDGHGHASRHGGVLVETADHSAHFEVVHDDEAGLVRIWLYDGEMNAVTTDRAPVLNVQTDDGPLSVTAASPDGKAASTEWHFASKALVGHVHKARFSIVLGGVTHTPDFPHDEDTHDDDHGHDHDDGHDHAHDDHGHDHDDGHDHAHEGHGPHHGVVAPFADEEGNPAGHLELKLHDDKGDLELWLAEDTEFKLPFDLDLDTEITVDFSTPRKERVMMAVRDRKRNEDEAGTANIRSGRTNYFIFPGATGADASWLQGKEFRGDVTVTFRRGEKSFTTKPFTLTPHTH